ncbi:hypothetical protein [Streptomyces agglomeratus]|uniref:hypothetical protein n=1 Tax=Streptomyces agglomeratus TaxID=285458 RepID=UPI0034E57FCE
MSNGEEVRLEPEAADDAELVVELVHRTLVQVQAAGDHPGLAPLAQQPHPPPGPDCAPTTVASGKCGTPSPRSRAGSTTHASAVATVSAISRCARRGGRLAAAVTRWAIVIMSVGP